MISYRILKFSWRPLRAYSSSKSKERVSCLPSGLLTSHPPDVWKRPKPRWDPGDLAHGDFELVYFSTGPGSTKLVATLRYNFCYDSDWSSI